MASMNDRELRDHIAAMLFPHGLNQATYKEEDAELEVRKRRFNDIARVCFIAADEFVKERRNANQQK